MQFVGMEQPSTQLLKEVIHVANPKVANQKVFGVSLKEKTLRKALYWQERNVANPKVAKQKVFGISLKEKSLRKALFWQGRNVANPKVAKQKVVGVSFLNRKP